MNATVVQFTLDLGDMSSGHTADPASLISRPKVWEEACNLLSEVRYPLEKGEAKVDVNWDSIADNAIATSLLNAALYERVLPADVIFKHLGDLTPEQRRPRVNCTVSLFGVEKSEESQFHTASHVVELFLYDLFLLLNLAAPGSCNLAGNFKSSRDDLSTNVKLSGYFLELAWVRALQFSWPSIHAIPLTEVIHWKNSLNIGTRQIAKSRTERAMFALLHVCKNDSYDPTTLLWLSHSLESLFDTRVTLVGESLKSRIISVLNVPADKQKHVRKQCGDFYDTRSDFVHGRLEIAHPLENDILDPHVDEYRDRLATAIGFGVSVCLATLQLQIQNGWREVQFKDGKITGVPIGPFENK